MLAMFHRNLLFIRPEDGLKLMIPGTGEPRNVPAWVQALPACKIACRKPPAEKGIQAVTLVDPNEQTERQKLLKENKLLRDELNQLKSMNAAKSKK